eukprot:SM000013S26478  [mRNA]  locus=s13:611469:617905:+ [translate_table: standard]
MDESRLAARRNQLRSTFGTQANALTRKNLAFQKRNWKSNCRLVSAPIILCLVLAIIQAAINGLLSGSKYKARMMILHLLSLLPRPSFSLSHSLPQQCRCGCKCVEYDSSNPSKCIDKRCGLEYSDNDQVAYCGVPHPTEWPAVQQVAQPKYRAAETPADDPFPYPGYPPSSCRSSSNAASECPATLLYTGANRTTADALAGHLLQDPAGLATLVQAAANNSDDLQLLLAQLIPASGTYPWSTLYYESAITAYGFQGGSPLYVLRHTCAGLRSGVNITIPIVGNITAGIFLQCLEGLALWRSSAAEINRELYAGYYKANVPHLIDEVSVAYDFQDTAPGRFAISVQYNETFANKSSGGAPNNLRLPRALNLATNAFARLVNGAAASVPLLFVKEMPKPSTKLRLDFSSLLGPLFYMWILQLLFPVMVGLLVYERQKHLRIMMKMHGLGDKSYWLVSYLYFLVISCTYIAFLILFGSLVGLKFFRKNDYALQILFYFVFANFQIAFSFFASSFFSNEKTATVTCYLYVYGSGLLGAFLFQFFYEDQHFSRGAVFAMELLPCFALYRGLYEFASYAFLGDYNGTGGMGWKNLGDSDNGLPVVFAILVIEWLIFLPLSYYFDQVLASGSGVKRHPLFFLDRCRRRAKADQLLSDRHAQNSTGQVDIELDRPDVMQEASRAMVAELLERGNLGGHAIICDDLRKMYPGRNGNPDKLAVRGMSLAVSRGECFGMLGPNGAGKTSSINMMIGFLPPTSGCAWIEGFSILEDMPSIYSIMGVCPQHDLLWEQLTAREHLLFYGRLKNLRGPALHQAVTQSLQSVNLLSSGVENKKAGTYSGGMKRRLSVAIALIGNPLVVYMDEPSTGLDPASRLNLWNVVKEAKKDCAIILTTHAMDEAEALCDRIGIFVDGQFNCIGNPKELTSRYGGSYMFTITTPPEHEADAARLATSLTPNAKKVYSLSGTQKFELPTNEVEIVDVFKAVEQAKQAMQIQAWGVANTTLEDVFITIAKEAQEGTVLS